MGVTIKPSDLRYKYRHDKRAREMPRFVGKPDVRPFDRDNLYQVLNMFEVVMDAFDTQDGVVLEVLEEVLIRDLPSFLLTREEVFDFLFHVMEEKRANLFGR
jgi:hypothetical protein